MKKIIIFTVFGIGLLLSSSCKETPAKVIKTEPIIFTNEGNLIIYKAETDTVLTSIAIEFAESSYETETGLMYRKSMEDKQGMLFIFSDVAMHFFYMKNTEFSLDIIFVDENLRIASFQENAQPLNEEGLSSQVPVKYVLEVNAGLVKKWALQVGDKIEFTKQ